MTCIGGNPTACSEGNASACEYKEYNSSLGMVNAYDPDGFAGGFIVSWSPAPNSDYFVRLMLRKDDENGFPDSSGYSEKINGEMVIIGLEIDTIYKLFLRLETDDEFGPWEQQIVFTSSVVSPDTKVVMFGDDIVLFNGLKIVQG